MITLSEHRQWLMDVARKAGDHFYNPVKERCSIARDTFWYAIALLGDATAERRALGNHLLSTVPPEDSSHTPATFLAILHRLKDAVDRDVFALLEEHVSRALGEAATIEWKDGNVNHPLAAYATLILGGERFEQPWAVELGTRKLMRFRERIGDHRGRFLRQAEMSEYNSPTYTALNLWFLGMIAEFSTTEPARRLGRFLEERLWIDIAMHFHAPSQQFAGPHSRAYADDVIGGCSALHCTMLAACDDPLYINPDLCYRFQHPSTLVQNALVAILPFHVPEQAKTIALRKPFPYTFQKTTYAESYHENSRQAGEGSAKQGAFAFDEEIYPGGWSDLTTHMTREYALGSAALPYVNAGHSESVMLRVRRGEDIRGMQDFRSMFTRGVFNGCRFGQKNFCHVARTPIDESYLYEEGRTATYQHEHRLITCYTPKRAGHEGVTSFRVEIIFTYASPFDAFMAGGTEVPELPFRVPPGVPLCFRDYQTYGMILPLAPVPTAGPILISRWDEFLVISMYNYDGSARDFSRHEINGWRAGFAMEMATAEEMSWEEFLARSARAHAEDWTHDGTLRSVRFASGNNTMDFTFDPYRESIVSRKWNGREEIISHLHVRAAGKEEGPFCPSTLFGKEAMV